MSIIEKLGITASPWKPFNIGLRNKKIYQVVGHIKIAHEIPKTDCQLIAAAPEMLEALIDLMTCDALKGHRTIIDNSRYSRLVEKATGKSWEEIKELIC